MKKYLLLILAALLLLCLASCIGEKDIASENPPETDITEDNSDNVLSAASVTRILEAKTEEMPVEIIIDDFNADGELEAYAITASASLEEGLSYYTDASLWFVKKENAERLTSSNIGERLSVFEFPDKKLLCVDLYTEKNTLSSVYFVSGNHAYSYGSLGGRLVRDADNSSAFYLIKKERDADYNMTSAEFESESLKPYYLYFDGNFFCEYGGREMREDQLRAISGADDILTALSEGGYIIDTIYRRQNGIVNINVSKSIGDGMVKRENVTLFLGEGTVRLVPMGTVESPLSNVRSNEAANEIISERFASPDKFSYSGTYLSALIPDIATYPEASGR